MVLENVTLFEVHLDDAQFSAVTGDGERSEGTVVSEAVDTADAVDESVEDRTLDEFDAETEEASTEAQSGRGRTAKLVVASVVVSLVATVAARRFVGRDSDPVAVELDADHSEDYSDADSDDPVDAGDDHAADSTHAGHSDATEW